MRFHLPKFLRIVLCIVIVFAGMLPMLLALFASNGLVFANRETPVIGTINTPAAPPIREEPARLTIMAYNIAKGFVHKGGLRFERADIMKARLRRIADLIAREQPDLVLLSEAIFECSPCPVNQVTFLAEAARMPHWAFGENYNFGLPFYRIVGGNAMLSRWPLTPKTNLSLIGQKPFYETKNNRRALWCGLKLGGEEMLIGSLHLDSYSPANNAAQARQLLEFLGTRPAFMGGDFNAQPNEPAMQAIIASGRFAWAGAGGLTFPASAPQQQIDYIFAPSNWECVEQRVIPADMSDHLPVVSVFRKK